MRGRNELIKEIDKTADSIWGVPVTAADCWRFTLMYSDAETLEGVLKALEVAKRMKG